MSKWAAMIKDALLDEAATSHSTTIERRKQDDAGSRANEQNNQAEVYPPHPVAVALLLACCQRIEASRDELVTELLKLKYLPPPEQVQRWALGCCENGLPAERVILSGVPSSGKAMDCMNCKHLEMILASRHGKRKQYHWSCARQHAILEVGYLGERVLLAPDTCNDYLL